MPACGSTTAAPSVRTCTRSIRKGAKPTHIVRGLGTLYTWNVVVAAPGRHHEAHRRRPNDAARELRAVQPGRADRRARPLPPRRDPSHDDRLRCRDRRLHDASSRWSIRRSTCSSIRRRARHARTSTPSAWIAKSGAGWRWRSRTCARMAATSSDGRMSAVSIARRRGRCPTAAACRCSCSSTPRPLAAFC